MSTNNAATAGATVKTMTTAMSAVNILRFTVVTLATDRADPTVCPGAPPSLRRRPPPCHRASMPVRPQRILRHRCAANPALNQTSRSPHRPSGEHHHPATPPSSPAKITTHHTPVIPQNVIPSAYFRAKSKNLSRPYTIPAFLNLPTTHHIPVIPDTVHRPLLRLSSSGRNPGPGRGNVTPIIPASIRHPRPSPNVLSEVEESKPSIHNPHLRKRPPSVIPNPDRGARRVGLRPDRPLSTIRS